MKDSAMADSKYLHDKQLINPGLWPPRSPDLNLCNYYLLGTLKDNVCELTFFSRNEKQANS
jgi:hypothetical protein